MSRFLPSSIEKFLRTESASGIVLALAAVLALGTANSPFAETYFHLLRAEIAGLSVHHWINDGLMTIFFFVIGLEIKKEFVAGQLSSLKRASLPVAAAFGGMLMPALIYAAFNREAPAWNGWGIPMATDIAFALGALTLFGSRVPASLKVFLLALAIVDDLGAVLVIALFYTARLAISGFAFAALGLLLIAGLRRLKTGSYALYTVAGALVWFGVLRSGVHATVAGVLLGFLTPLRFFSRDGEELAPLDDLLHRLHAFSGFVIMPVFALANSGISLRSVDFSELIAHPVFFGVGLGLIAGKPVGILAFSAIAIACGWAAKPKELTWGLLAGAGFLGGIGFTMALFISELALPEDLQTISKAGILGASVIAGSIGAASLAFTLNERKFS